MSHRIALNFEDGVTRFIDCAPTETVADASYKLGINIPLDCRDGACGTCKSFCDSGTFDPGDFIDDALTEEELDKGYLLTCQAVPESDMSIQVPATAESAKTSAASSGSSKPSVWVASSGTAVCGSECPASSSTRAPAPRSTLSTAAAAITLVSVVCAARPGPAPA